MTGKQTGACLASLIALLGCEASLGLGSGNDDDVVIDSAEAASHVAAERGIDTTYEEEERTNSDGERIKVYVPTPVPTIEVPEGGGCGVEGENGAVPSCAPGTYCLAAAPDEPGVCVAGPRAPVPEAPGLD